MLSKNDIQFIKNTRDEIIQNRTETVTVYRKVKDGESPLTGDPIYREIEDVLECTWSRITSQTEGSPEITMVNGVVIESGDIIADFDIEADLTGVERVVHPEYGEFRVRTKAPIGLGDDNRIHTLLRSVK